MGKRKDGREGDEDDPEMRYKRRKEDQRKENDKEKKDDSKHEKREEQEVEKESDFEDVSFFDFNNLMKGNRICLEFNLISFF